MKYVIGALIFGGLIFIIFSSISSTVGAIKEWHRKKKSPANRSANSTAEDSDSNAGKEV